MVRNIGVARYFEIHGNSSSDRIHPDGPRRHVLIALPKNCLHCGTVVARTGHRFADAAQTQVNAVRGVGIELQVNSSREVLSWGKWKRVEFEIRIPISAVPQCRAQCDDKQDYAYRAYSDNHEYAWIIPSRKLRRNIDSDRNRHQIAEHTNHPCGDLDVLFQALGSSARPVRPPKPRCGRIRLFERGLFL